MSAHEPELPELRSRIDAALAEVLEHGHGRIEIDIDTNQPGRRRAVLRVWKSWLHFVGPDELARRTPSGGTP